MKVIRIRVYKSQFGGYYTADTTEHYTQEELRNAYLKQNEVEVSKKNATAA